MRILLISRYPPLRDGLANYTAQVAAGLRAEGHHVEVLSPEPSAAAHHEPLHTFGGLWRAARVTRRFDRVIVQFQPETFFPSMALDQFLPQWLALYLFFLRSRQLEVVVHETLKMADPLRSRLWGALWRRPRTLLVHSEVERQHLVGDLGVPAVRVQLIDHGEHFQRRSSATREDARRRLGIDPDAFEFLCIGFVQPHKGFDRAADALARLDGDHLRLDIVGEIRVHTLEHDRYLRMLQDQAKGDPRVHVQEGYVSDEEFDQWIVASDVVVLPYRTIWSSGVIERASLYGRPTIVTPVGGLPAQAGETGTVVDDLPSLVEAMAKHAGVGIREAVSGGTPAATTPAAIAQAAVRARGESLRRWHDPLDRPDRPGLPVDGPETVEIAPLALPPTPPVRGVRPFARKVVRRLTAWELQPVVDYVNGVRALLVDHLNERQQDAGRRSG